MVVAAVAAQRAGELVFAAANTRRLRAQGAIEVDPGGYKWFVLLHAGWLAALAATAPRAATPSWPLLAAYGVLQLGRLWVIAALRRRWTTRIIILPRAPLIRSGPYRRFRHPNYAIVAGEIAVLPLAFGAIRVALLFSLANLVLTVRRIAIEDRALAPNRTT